MSDDYGNFDSLIHDVVKAACWADLRINGWVLYPDGSVAYANMGLGGGEPIHRPGPGQGGYPDDPLNPNGMVSPGPDGQLRPPSTTVGDSFRTWEREIPPLFEPFRGLPDPANFQPLADEVRQALKQLDSRGSTGSGSSTDSDKQSANIDYEGNTTLGLASQVAQTLNGWQGGAATAFATYLNLFTVVVGNQALACEALRITLLEEKEMWTRMRNDAVAFAKSAKSAFDGAGGLTTDDIKAILSVTGTIETVLGWFPAFAPVAGPLGKANSVAGVLVDTFGSSKNGETNDLAARGPFDILHKCQSHRDQLQGYSKTVEGDIQKSLQNIYSHISAAPAARSNGTTDQASYKLDRPSATYSATKVSDFIYGTLQVNPANVRAAAHQLEKDLAPEMQTAANALDGGDSAWQWYRDGSGIGVGTWGAYDYYSKASTLIQTEIAETAHEMTWAGEMLDAVAADLEGTDTNVGGHFNDVRKEINGYDHPAPPVVALPRNAGGRNIPI